MNSLDWNDLRYVLAVAKQGSAAAAARALGVSHATVLRRINVIEKDIGSPLFDRHATGYTPTEAGRTLTAAGAEMDAAITEARRMIDGRTADLSGTVKFTTTDSLGLHVIPQLLDSFRMQYPAIEIEMLVTNNALDLDRRDADITLRPSAHPPENWVGRRLVRMDFAVYASQAYLDKQPKADWTELDWLFPSGSISGAPASRWLATAVAVERAVLKADSFVALRSLAQAGLGATLLPLFLAEQAPELQRLANAPEIASADIWVLTHPNLRQSARIGAFISHLSSSIREMRHSFELAEPSQGAV